ncbi:MAG: N-6 DNA methylase [Chloroflexi bacterium RBG_16_68_14]|nr:MAG: N-6 DNA methylase [Chloroflexi bacterium RBG_16_68_14]
MARRPNSRNGNNGRPLNSQASLNGYIKSICDIMRRSNCAGALQYVPELTWMLFLRILDDREEQEAEGAKALGVGFTPSLVEPYRWRDWASPDGAKRQELQAAPMGAYMAFVNDDLLPHLRSLGDRAGATHRQLVISQVFATVERTRIDTERNLLDILDKIDALSGRSVDDTHMFPLSQVYEGLLLKMGEKNNDGGQFFTPREVIRAMVRAVNPQIGQTVYDPCCGTGGFLAQAYEYMQPQAATASEIEQLKTETFYGREKENLVYPIALANTVLHGIDGPHIWHGNTLTGVAFHAALYTDAPALFDVVLTNPPFGGKENKDAQANFAYKTGATQLLFLQHVIDALADGGTCGIVMDEGALFRTNETAFVQTKRKLLDECDLYCIVSLPAGVFINAGAASKTNLLFFRKGQSTERIWYYDLSDVKVRKRTPFTLAHFDDFLERLALPPDDPERESERSWWVSIDEVRARTYDLKAVNPNRKDEGDTRTPEELIAIIEAKQAELSEALAALRRSLGG